MGYDWTEAEQGGYAEAVPVGVWQLKIARLSFKPRPARDGSPKMMIIFADEQERETFLTVTLSEKAGWVLAKLMSRFGIDLDELKAQGVEPHHFSNPSLAESWLIGREGCCVVTRRKGDDGKDYPEVEPKHVDELTDEQRAAYVLPKPEPKDDCPI